VDVIGVVLDCWLLNIVLPVGLCVLLLSLAVNVYPSTSCSSNCNTRFLKEHHRGLLGAQPADVPCGSVVPTPRLRRPQDGLVLREGVLVRREQLLPHGGLPIGNGAENGVQRCHDDRSWWVLDTSTPRPGADIGPLPTLGSACQQHVDLNSLVTLSVISRTCV
jgi:hypothetical protein